MNKCTLLFIVCSLTLPHVSMSMEPPSETLTSRPVKVASSFDSSDYQNVLKRTRHQGFLEGKKQGLLEGEKKAAREVAQRALAKGWTAEKIKEITDLSIEEIKALRKPAGQ